MSIARVFGRLVATLALLVAAAGAAAQDVVLDGRYRGTGSASGSVVEIAPDPGGFEGRFTTPAGGTQDFLADRIGDMAEAVIDLDGRVWIMQLQPRPFGAEMALVPLTEEGKPDVRSGRIEMFLGEGSDGVRYPDGYAREPVTLEGRIAANSFLVSYSWWRPAGVAAGYTGLNPRIWPLIRLFPEVQLDIIWKLCLAPRDETVDRALALALRGEPVNCEDVRAVIAGVQSAGRYGAYRRSVEQAAETLRVQIRCADNYVMPEGTCADAARAVAEAAASLETTATVLSRYR